MKVNLQGKIAVITGGSGYLCSEMGTALSRNGASVIVLGRRQEKIDQAVDTITQAGTQARGLSVDVTQKEALQEAYDTIVQQWGTCDILINGAGGNSPKVSSPEEFCSKETLKKTDSNTFFNFDIQDIEENVRLNFISALQCTQLFAKDMVKKGNGSVINISSMATINAITRVASYSASKAALDNLTHWLAVYFSKVGIRVNAISPGFFIGEQNKRLLLEEDGTYTERGNKIIRNTPMERFGVAEELTSTLLYLVSDESKFVTGQIIKVDGGFSIYSGV